MPSYAIFGVVGVYAVVAILLLSLNVFSLWRWPIKASAIVVTSGLFIGSYLAIDAMLGWPSSDRVPARASFLASRIVEPDKLTGAHGVIFIWLQNVDDKNLPVGDPRAYRLDYSRDIARKVVEAQRLRFQGRDMIGSFQYTDEHGDKDKSGMPVVGEKTTDPLRPGGAGGLVSLDQDLQAVFVEMPPLALPDKVPIQGNGPEEDFLQ
jgi:hypothetical protein